MGFDEATKKVKTLFLKDMGEWSAILDFFHGYVENALISYSHNTMEASAVYLNFLEPLKYFRINQFK